MALGTLTLATVVVALIGVWLSHRLAKDRDAEKSRNEARGRLRSAVEPVLLTLREKRIDAHALMIRERVQIDTAIAGFRVSLKSRALTTFDDAAQKFSLAAGNLSPGILAFYEREATGESDYDDRVNQLVTALQGLLRSAE